MRLKTLVLATTNPHKIEELRFLLLKSPYAVLTLSDFPPMSPVVESGCTFLENAILKARFTYQHTKTPSLGEDSGLIVNALGNEPGLRSRRYAGEKAGDAACIRKLLSVMRSLSGSERRAYYHASMALWWEDDDQRYCVHAEGSLTGHISDAAYRPVPGAFGYDPVFIPSGYDKPFTKLPKKVKMMFSHRSKALEGLLQQLR